MAFHDDLDKLTRDMHDKSWEVEYMKKNPVTALMLERKNLKFKGGKKYYKNLDVRTTEDLVQDYTVNEPLTHGVKDTSEEATFRRKKFQSPIQIDCDEELENAEQTGDGTQLQNLAKYRTMKIQEGVRFHIRKLLYRRNGHSLGATDGNKYMQGLNAALTVDGTYGEIARTTASDINNFWQQANDGYTTTTQSTTEYPISILWLRAILEPLEDLETDNTDLITIVGGSLYLALQAEAESRGTPYKIVANRTARQGFEEMILDNRRVVKDPFLQASNNAAMGTTSAAAGALERRLYCLNLKDWDMYIHPKRNFKLTEFFDQSKIANGSDFKLARIFFAGNLVCWHPNRQLMLENVTG
jgi:hypothetical protein